MFFPYIKEANFQSKKNFWHRIRTWGLPFVLCNAHALPPAPRGAPSEKTPPLSLSSLLSPPNPHPWRQLIVKTCAYDCWLYRIHKDDDPQNLTCDSAFFFTVVLPQTVVPLPFNGETNQFTNLEGDRDLLSFDAIDGAFGGDFQIKILGFLQFLVARLMPTPPPPTATSLASGFRFHPTDQ